MKENEEELWIELENTIKEIKKKREETREKKRLAEMYGNLLPIAMKVSAKTIGLDLVSVQPMPIPKMKLMYFDYKYNETKFEKIKRKIKEYLLKIKNKITNLWK